MNERRKETFDLTQPLPASKSRRRASPSTASEVRQDVLADKKGYMKCEAAGERRVFSDRIARDEQSAETTFRECFART